MIWNSFTRLQRRMRISFSIISVVKYNSWKKLHVCDDCNDSFAVSMIRIVWIYFTKENSTIIIIIQQATEINMRCDLRFYFMSNAVGIVHGILDINN